MKLNELRDNEGARKTRIRVGRGIGSGKGKTSGKGVKGQKARSGVAVKGFEGGQMPIHRRLPKRGFTPPGQKSFSIVNLGQLQAGVEAGKFAAGSVVDEAMLVSTGIVRRARDGIRLLAKGELTVALTLNLSGVSAAAKVAVEQAGGSVNVPAPAADA